MAGGNYRVCIFDKRQ